MFRRRMRCYPVTAFDMSFLCYMHGSYVKHIKKRNFLLFFHDFKKRRVEIVRAIWILFSMLSYFWNNSYHYNLRLFRCVHCARSLYIYLYIGGLKAWNISKFISFLHILILLEFFFLCFIFILYIFIYFNF